MIGPMDLYGAESRSIPQKTLSIVIEIALLYVSWRLLFGDWGASFARWMHWPASADWNRRAAVLAFNLIVFARTTFMMLVLLKRKMPLEEAISVPFAFAVYYVGFALFALRTARPLGADGVVGIALFCVGSFLNSGAEVQRWLWKRHPENRGHLYTGGLFSLSMHINYFGDVLWVTGYALVAGNPWGAILPVVLFCFFAFFNAPKLDQHLAQHYGAEFEAYAKKTRKLVPFLY
jgi:protein-S-isoprenylcysteine O-methyltransferase Ste14